MTIGWPLYADGMLSSQPKLVDPAYSVPDDQVRALRRLAKARGLDLDRIVDWPLRVLLHRVRGDVDLAVTAIAMRPRPGWLYELIAGER